MRTDFLVKYVKINGKSICTFCDSLILIRDTKQISEPFVEVEYVNKSLSPDCSTTIVSISNGTPSQSRSMISRLEYSAPKISGIGPL